MNQRKDEYPLKVTRNYTIERFTFKKLLGDIVSAFNLERGLIYTLKMLFINPGRVVNTYLYEGRHQIFQPVRLLFISSAISFLVLLLIGGEGFVEGMQNGFLEGAEMKEDDAVRKKTLELFNTLFEDYFNLIIWLQIPVFSVFTYLLFRKSNYNYTENLILLTYITSAINVLSIFSYVLIGLFSSTVFFIFSTITSIVYYVYCLKSFFERSWWNTIYKTLVIYIIGSLVYMIVMMFLAGLYVGYHLASVL